MTNYLHKASGVLASGAFWSFGLKTTGSISESAAETAWSSGVNGFFATAGVAALYSTGTELTLTSTSTASSTWKQTTITRTTHTQAGTATTQELPDQDAMIVTYRSANATKSGHGRWFMPAPVAAAFVIGTGCHMSAASATTLSTALATLWNGLVTAGLSPVILTRKATLSGLPAFSTQAVTTRELVHTLGVQTRRGDKLIPLRTTF